MGTTYNAGVVSIAAAHNLAHLCVDTAHTCVLRATDLGWQRAASATPATTPSLVNTQQLLPLAARRGTGVSVISPEAGFMSSKRIRSFEGHLGPQLGSGTG